MSDNQFKSIELFEGKNLSDLFEEIYNNSASKRDKIKELINSLIPLIDGIGDATLLVPLIKEYMDISVKNDDQLIKLAQIVQRLDASNAKVTKGGDIWSDLSGLLEESRELDKQVSTVETEAKSAVHVIN